MPSIMPSTAVLLVAMIDCTFFTFSPQTVARCCDTSSPFSIWVTAAADSSEAAAAV